MQRQRTWEEDVEGQEIILRRHEEAPTCCGQLVYPYVVGGLDTCQVLYNQRVYEAKRGPVTPKCICQLVGHTAQRMTVFSSLVPLLPSLAPLQGPLEALTGGRYGGDKKKGREVNIYVG